MGKFVEVMLGTRDLPAENLEWSSIDIYIVDIDTDLDCSSIFPVAVPDPRTALNSISQGIEQIDPVVRHRQFKIRLDNI